MVMLPDPFRGLGAHLWEIQQSSHVQRSVPEIEEGRSNGALERFRCGIVEKEMSQILQLTTARRNRCKKGSLS